MKTFNARLIAVMLALVTLLSTLTLSASASSLTSMSSTAAKYTFTVSTSANWGSCNMRINSDGGNAVFMGSNGKKMNCTNYTPEFSITTVKCGSGKKASYSLKTNRAWVTLKFNWASAYTVTVKQVTPAFTYKGVKYTFDHWEKPASWFVSDCHGIICCSD